MRGSEPFPEDLLRQRRNLIGICVALLLFIFSGGSLNSIFGVDIKHSWVAEVFAGMGLLYFYWRYWMYRQEHGMNLINDIFVEAVPFTHLKDKVIKSFDEQLREEGHISGNKKVIKIIDFNAIHNTWRFYITDGKAEMTSNIKIKSRVFCVKALAPFFHKVFFRHRTFSDDLLPYVLAWLTMIVGAVHYAC
ncbi:MAG: hypothetical protein GQ573_07240 [Gammaproteobacteria bacterium]|nr:hypothetical protein [Gammaproteobacteria bacterium]